MSLMRIFKIHPDHTLFPFYMCQLGDNFGKEKYICMWVFLLKEYIRINSLNIN